MKFERGFTLVELMIVVVIVGVLMAYVIPSYQTNVIISKRTEAHNAIMQIAAVQERSNATHHQYAADFDGAAATKDDLGLLTAIFMSSVDYTYSMTLDDGYTITADAIGNTQVNDNNGTDCTSMTLNSLGQKLPLDCWQ